MPKSIRRNDPKFDRETTCPSCAGATVESLVLERVPMDDIGTVFEVEVPIIGCGACGLSFTDERAERLRHEAACRFEGLLTSKEVQEIRLSLDMSRAEFGEAFGIPSASMERWENGRLLQNRSMDTLLRALGHPSTACRLDRRKKGVSSPSEGNVIRFPTLAISSRLQEAEFLASDFDLRVSA